MSTTQDGAQGASESVTAPGAGSGPSATPATGTPSHAADPAPGAPATPAAPDTAPPADERANDRRAPTSKVSTAFERAQARIAAARGSDTDIQQRESAAESGAAGGQEPPGAADQPAASQPADGAVRGSDNNTAPVAPEQWPESWKSALAEVPDSARAQALAFAKVLERDTSEKLQSLTATQRARGALDQAMTQHGLDDTQVASLVALQARFDREPMTVLGELAKQAGVPIFFTPEADEEIPEFNDSKEFAQWMRQRDSRLLQQATEAAQQRLAQERAAADTANAQHRAMTDLRAELKAVTEQFGEDFKARWPDIQASLALAPKLSLEQHYRLASLPSLLEQAERGKAAEAEAAALRSELDQLKAQAGRPAGKSGSGDPQAADETLRPVERAYKRAQRRIAGAMGR